MVELAHAHVEPRWCVREMIVAANGLRLAALLFSPPAPPRGALLICHGAGSTKENHAIMAEQAAAAGLAAMVFDFRGHGASDGAMDAGGEQDVIACGEALASASRAPWLAARGSSMGANSMLRAAHARPGLFRSLVVLCPADEAALLRGLDALRRPAARDDPDAGQFGRFDQKSLRRLLSTSSIVEIARGLPRVLLAHAFDDASVPFSVSLELACVVTPPTRLIALAEGGHRGPQRSPEVARATLEWVIENG
jgi:pimeloyl-ACP methyl ester carboxylesterase